MEHPHSLGRYDLVSYIARGGMADVFEAVDRTLDRRVAVKIMHQRYADAETFVARFRKEAQAAANLSHPNIVSIYDWGEEKGTYYIVMELIAGRSLRDVLNAEGKLLPRRAAEIATEVASALEVAHRSRVIHRDIKPGNILLAPDGSVKVTDFGVARVWDDSQELTKDGSVIGTATYFSPEQARGDPADERSDLYSLGVVLYEMLTGRPPFTGETSVSVAYQHVTAEAPSPAGANPDLAPELEAVVMRCLEKNPARRYRSAADVRRDLLLFLQGRAAPRAEAGEAVHPVRRPDLPPPTAPPDEVYRRVHAAPRQPSQLPFIITSIALAAGVVFGIYVLLNSLSTQPPPTSTAAAPAAAVPDVAGLTEDEALLALQEAGFRVMPAAEASEEEPGRVIRTDPAAGERAASDSFVTMVVSSGRAQIQVPTVIGSTRERAIAALEGQGFTVVVRSVRNEAVGEGLVTEQSPAAGAMSARGSAVELVVSAGPDPIEIPDVRGLTQDRAEGRLEGIGLEVETVFEAAGAERGVVIRQSPAAGSDVNPGWSVQIVVSEGTPPFALEDMSGRPAAEAAALLVELGLEVEARQEPAAGAAPGLVVRTEPPAGSVMQSGDRVILVEASPPEEPASTAPSEPEEPASTAPSEPEEPASTAPSEPPPPGPAVVPDLTGGDPAEAEAELAALGLVLEVAGSRAAVDHPGLDGKIARQAPSAGAEVPAGETVLVVLGDYTPPPTEAPEEQEDQSQ